MQRLGSVATEKGAYNALRPHGKECSFDALVKKHGLRRDPAIALLAKIVNGADTNNTL
jgi:hypothetical protein